MVLPILGSEIVNEIISAFWVGWPDRPAQQNGRSSDWWFELSYGWDPKTSIDVEIPVAEAEALFYEGVDNTFHNPNPRG